MADDFVPRTEIGRWNAEERLAKPAAGTRYDDRRVAYGFGKNSEIQLKRGSKILGRVPWEQPPKTSWGGTCDEALAFSGNGERLWHLRYHQGRAQAALFDGNTLELLDSHDPIRFDRYELKEEPLKEWYELRVSIAAAAPDVLIAFANAGDSFYALLTLQATDDGICDPVGNKLFNAVADRLDQRLWGATFTAPDRFLAIDDIGQLTLFSWPDVKVVSSYSVLRGLRDDDSVPRLWPEDSQAEKGYYVAEEVGIVGDLLLLGIYESADTPELRGLIALEAETLNPVGLVRPPRPSLKELTQLDGDRFGAVQGGKLYCWTFSI